MAAGSRQAPQLVLATFAVTFLVPASFASTHWVVTEEGKIQANENSVFDLKRPHDLVALIRQEERLTTLENLKEELINKGTLESMERWQQDVSLESSLFEKDEDCMAAGGPLSEFDLFVSVVVFPEEDTLQRLIPKVLIDEEDLPPWEASTHEGATGMVLVDGEDYNDVDADGEDLAEPICSFLKPPYSMENEEFLSGTETFRNNEELKMIGGETTVLTVSLNGRILTLSHYGHLTAKALRRFQKGDKASEEDRQQAWLACLFAANYWRIRGDAAEAIECSRKAIQLAPRGEQFMGMVALAVILHRSHRTEEAEKVLLKAVPLAPKTPAVFFTLANIQAALLKFPEAVENFDKTLQLQPRLEAAKMRRHAVLCHMKVEEGLEVQHVALQNTLEELRKYREIHDEWTSVLALILNDQAPLEVRLRSGMEYEYIKSLISEESKSEGEKRNNSGHLVSDCRANSEEIALPDLLGRISVQDGVMRLDIKSVGKSDVNKIKGEFEVPRVRKAETDQKQEEAKGHSAILEVPTLENIKQTLLYGADGMDSGSLASSEGLVAMEDAEILRRNRKLVDSTSFLSGQGRPGTFLFLEDEDFEVGNCNYFVSVITTNGGVEVGSVSLTVNQQMEAAGPVHLSLFEEDALESVLEGLPGPSPSVHLEKVSWDACIPFTPAASGRVKHVKLAAFLSPRIKGVDLAQFLKEELEENRDNVNHLPFCETVPTSLRVPDHLPGVALRSLLKMDPEIHLIYALLAMGSPAGSGRTTADSLSEMGSWIANGLKANSTSWVLSTAASLYWRVMGKAEEAVSCLRHALYYCPQNLRDVPLFSLSNVFLASGLENHALILAHNALNHGDNFLVQFAIGFVNERKGNFEKAKGHFYSAVKQQPVFQPAKSSLMFLECANLN